jgi:hypothetical protein
MKIKRVSQLSKQAFMDEYLIPHQPVIVTDAMDSWDIEKFRPEHLDRAFGHYDVQIYNDLFELQTIDTLNTYLHDNFNKPAGVERSHEYIRWYSQLRDVDFYWSDEVFLSLKNAWSHPYFLPEDSFVIPNAAAGMKADVTECRYPYRGLFISGKGARTRLHRDPFNSNAVLCQFHGAKKLYLYAPDQERYVMNGKEFVDIDEPDLRQFPDFPKAVCSYEDVLVPGEVVFFPAGWFHDVTSESDSISITWNFVHATETAGLHEYIDRHRSDDQLEIVRFFLKDKVGGEADAQEIIDFLKTHRP